MAIRCGFYTCVLVINRIEPGIRPIFFTLAGNMFERPFTLINFTLINKAQINNKKFSNPLTIRWQTGLSCIFRVFLNHFLQFTCRIIQCIARFFGMIHQCKSFLLPGLIIPVFVFMTFPLCGLAIIYFDWHKISLLWRRGLNRSILS
ncbi:MAG: hypothetical protein ACD_73C00534G0003 [uncultured bacterium]|nr:MAG: hypothetical protein ACD_73C00534G0003 [uncultured bacterium]